MRQGNTSLLNYKKKVLTNVGAFFVAGKAVSVLSRNNCPARSRIYKPCFKSKNETGNLQGFIEKKQL